MAIETNLNQSPYFDDFDENKNFQRILFRPGYSVQARELTQLQTILQNQIEKFANEVVIDGTIITGGGLITDQTNYVRLLDKDANSQVVLLGSFFENGLIANATIYGANTGVTAKLVSAIEGSEAAAPDYLTVYCHYTNSGDDNTTRTFADDEVLIFRRSSNNQFIAAAKTISSNSTGKALKANISDGVIYHKGHFIRLPAQSVIVGKYTTTPNKLIGLTTEESIVDSNQDSSLLDNSTGSTNFSAPGANRLKLYPRLTVKDYGFANTESFFTVATVESGSIVQRTTDTVYSDIGKFVAERLYDTNGNFVTDPFNIRIREHLKKENSLGRYEEGEGGDYLKLVAEIEKGTGYVSGNKIQLQASRFVDVDKATSHIQKNAMVVGQAFGNYVNVNECVGTFDFNSYQLIGLYDTKQEGISGLNFGQQASSGTEIGTARVRGIQWDSGTPGTVEGRFRIYLFDVQMNSGKSFADVKSLWVDNGSYNSMADIVLETNGFAKIQESNLNTMVFPFGQRATKTLKDEDNNVDTQFVYRKSVNVNFSNSGIGVVSLPTAHTGGTETNNDTGSPLSNVDERNILVISRQATETTPHKGYISAFSGNSVTGSGTAFQSQYQVGDIITIVDGANNVTQRITELTADNLLKVANNIGYNRTSVVLPHKTIFPSGYIFDLTSNGTITSTSTQHQISLQQANLTSSFESTVYFNVLRSDAVQTAKQVNKNRYIKINTGSHTASKTGPWSLGVSDAYKLIAVFKGSNTGVTTSDNDVTSHFELDTGMKDAFYDTSYLRLKADSTLDLTNAGLLVKFNYFNRDRSAGIGFLSVDSYPIDDAYIANTAAITTQEIPVFRSPSTGIEYDLRDCVDFRPIKQNTVTPTSTEGSAPVNPSVLTTFDIHTDGAYVPTPDENFQCDVQFYLPRRDRIVMTRAGALQVTKGIPDLSPRAPDEIAGSMSLGLLDVPPYPSLSPYVGKQYKRSDYAVKLTLDNNRRYTMKDLRAIEERIKSLEYYSTLNLLETQAKNKQLFNESGTDRFKNGFFVDDMGSHASSDTKNPFYRAGIDVNLGVLRPTFTRSDISMSNDLVFTSSGVTKTGDLITLNYTHEQFIEQPYASKLRNPVQELLFNWRGQVILDPPADNTPDITQLPEIQVDFSGFYDAIETIVQETGILDQVSWGGWNIVSTGANDRFNRRTSGNLGGGAVRERLGITTTLESVTQNISFGNMVENVSVREFMRSREIRFTGVRLKPNTKVYAYFDEEKVSSYCTPCDSSFNDTGVEGNDLITDSTGTVYGKFRIPDDNNLRFRVGTKRFVLRDISDPATEQDLITTSGHGEYTSIPLDVKQRGVGIEMQVPQFANETVVQRQVLNTVADGDRAWWDPIAQTFNVNVSGSTDGVYITKLDFFFGKKDSTLPITLQIREVQNGFPTETIVPYGLKTLPASSINISSDASVATTFTFDTPVFLKNNTDYAMVLVPGGNSDQYAVWTAKLGGDDVFRPNTLINKQTYSGVLFSSSNDKTWNPIQDEDIKFTMYRANFSTGSGTVYIENDAQDYFTVDNLDGAFRIGETVRSESVLTFANNQTIVNGTVLKSKAAQDGLTITNANYANGVVRQVVSANSVAGTVTVKLDAIGTFPTTATSSANYLYNGAGTLVGTSSAFTANTATGVVSFYHGIAGKLYVSSSTASFANGWVRGQKSGASARVVTVDNLRMNTMVPKIPVINHYKTATSWGVRTTSSGGVISPEFVSVNLSQDNNFYDNEKTVYSATNEQALSARNGSKKSLTIRGTLSTTDNHVSPVVDTTRLNSIILGNIINNDSTGEDKNYGNAQVRYISKSVTLADGQDAEDLVVFVNAYKPQGTDMFVYARVLNGEDGEVFSSKDYTPLIQKTAANTFSTGLDGSDIREFEFGIPVSSVPASGNCHAVLNSGNNEIIAYRDTAGAIYHTYKTFAIKIVLTSTGTNIVPFVDDLRAIALQK